MLVEKYKGYEIYVLDPSFYSIGKDIIDKKYRVEESFKSDHRSLVLKIKTSDNEFILKSPLNESRRFIKKIRTIFSRGEVMNTFFNINALRKQGMEDLYIPYIAIIKREKGMITESFLVTEYIHGRIIRYYEDFKDFEKEKIVKVLEKLHSMGVYHGDANHGNFIFQEGNIRIIDTQGKKDIFTYKRNYDFITLEDCIKGIYELHKFNKKDPFYWLALWTKKYKKSNIEMLLKRIIKRGK